MKKRRRRKPLTNHMRFRKNDPSHNLLAAVQHWVKARGGLAIIIGGIEVQDWRDGTGKYRVAIRCMGRAPKKAEPTP